MVIGAVMFVITTLGVTWRRFLERRLFKVSGGRAIDNPLVVGVIAALFGMAFFGVLIALLGLTEPNSCG